MSLGGLGLIFLDEKVVDLVTAKTVLLPGSNNFTIGLGGGRHCGCDGIIDLQNRNSIRFQYASGL